MASKPHGLRYVVGVVEFTWIYGGGAIKYCRPILASLWHALLDVKKSVEVTDNT